MKNSFSLVALSFASALAVLASRAGAEVDTATGSACETQQTPSMPRDALQRAQHDKVRVRALVHDGAIRQVEIVKGPRLYASAIRAAMERYRCRVQQDDFWVHQDFEFDARGQ